MESVAEAGSKESVKPTKAKRCKTMANVFSFKMRVVSDNIDVLERFKNILQGDDEKLCLLCDDAVMGDSWQKEDLFYYEFSGVKRGSLLDWFGKTGEKCRREANKGVTCGQRVNTLEQLCKKLKIGVHVFAKDEDGCGGRQLVTVHHDGKCEYMELRFSNGYGRFDNLKTIYGNAA